VTRLDAELVRRGMARSRRRAVELVLEGKVRVAGAVADKPAQPVAPDDALDVEGGDDPVSRGAHKLSGALEDLRGLGAPLPVHGARCLDAGASTGGFTQVLLEAGAAHVDAVDVGHGQLAEAIAADPRVTAAEGVNVRELTPQMLAGPPTVVVADLSFISLTLVLDALAGVLAPGGQMLLLVKPQFEVGRERLGAGGVVTDDRLRARAVLDVVAAASATGRVEPRAVLPSRLPGPSGNRELFVHLVDPAPARHRLDLTGELARAVDAAVGGRPALVRPPHHVPRRTA